jgi:imidazolonepropionase-like amidohydrolase
VIDGERIVRVGSAGEFRYPAGTTVISLRDRWLVPGFMDLHAHIDVGGQPQPGDFDARRAATLLAFGITTIRSPAAAREAGTDLRDRIASGRFATPERSSMWLAGKRLKPDQLLGRR